VQPKEGCEVEVSCEAPCVTTDEMKGI